MPHRGPRHARPARPAVGLGRRTPTEPERLPPDRSGSRDPVGKVAFVVHARRLHLAPCRSPRARPASSKAGKSLRAIPPLPGSSRVAPRLTVPARKMCLSDFCNRPAIRAPCASSDSRSRSPSRRAVLRPRDVPAHADPPSTAGSGLRPLQHPDGEPSGGASLDGEPPASASLQPSRSTSSEPEPRFTRLVRAPRVPGEASIESSSAPCFPTAALSAADRARS